MRIQKEVLSCTAETKLTYLNFWKLVSYYFARDSNALAARLEPHSGQATPLIMKKV